MGDRVGVWQEIGLGMVGDRVRACGVSNCVIHSPINFIFGIAIDNTVSGRTLVIFSHSKWPLAAIL